MAVKQTGDMTWPFPLGKVFPGASFATVSAPLTQNTTPVDADNVTPDVRFTSVRIQAAGANTAKLYVCSTAAQPDVTNFTNVIAELAAGVVYEPQRQWGQTRSIDQLFIGALNSADFAIVSIDQQ